MNIAPTKKLGGGMGVPNQANNIARAGGNISGGQIGGMGGGQGI